MLQVRYHNKVRGSALVFTLILTGIMMLILGAMLSSVSYMTRSANDKISQEEAYHVALSGINVAKSWLFDPALAAQHTGDTNTSTSFGAVRAKAVEYTQDVQDYLGSAPNVTVVTPQEIPPQNRFTGATVMTDGRYKILEYSTNDADNAVYFRRDVATTPTEDLFEGPDTNLHACVERMRITSPYPTDNLRIVKLILEAEGVVYGAGLPKRRILQQKINVIPSAGSDEAGNGFSIVANGGVTVQGQSHLGVRWGSVFGTGDLKILAAQELTYSVNPNTGKYTFNWQVDNNKFVAAGVNTGQDPSPATLPMDKWVRYQTAGVIYSKYDHANADDPYDLLFPATIPSPPTNNGYLNGQPIAGQPVPVTDFFTQIQRGDWDNTPGASESGPSPGVNLTGYDLNYNSAGGIMYGNRDPDPSFDPNAQNLEQRGWQMGSGAFVQNTPSITTWINNFISTNYWSDTGGNLPYNQWKQKAVDDGIYLSRDAATGDYEDREGRKQYVDRDGNLTPVAGGNTALRDNNLDRIDVWEQVIDGDTSAIPDKVLMIDAPGQTINLPSSFFWKGLLYINGNFDGDAVQAGNRIRAKSPDQWTGVVTSPAYYTVGHAFLDGVLFTTGNITRQGNNLIYGSIVAKGSVENTSGDPEILYNNRLRIGQFRDPLRPIGNGSDMISGPISEADAWVS